MYFIETRNEGARRWHRHRAGWWSSDTAAANAVKWLAEGIAVRIVWAKDA
jgi:hypothetical protein